MTLVLMLLLAQVKPQPCRPTVACTAELVPAGHLELEVGGLASPGIGSANVLVKLSLLDWLQVQLGSDNALVFQNSVTVMDGAVGVLKARLLEQHDAWPTISLSVRAVTPTRPPLPALQSAVDLGATAHVSKDVGPLHVDLNGTLACFALQQFQGQAALAVSTAVSSFGFALEAHSTFGNPLRANDGGVRGVITFAPADAVVFDVGADVGFSRRRVRGRSSLVWSSCRPRVDQSNCTSKPRIARTPTAINATNTHAPS